MNGTHHRLRGVTLKNVATHIHARSAATDCVVCHVECVTFWQLFTTRHHYRDRTRSSYGLESFGAVVSLDNLRSKLRTHPTRESQILRIACEFLSHRSNCHSRNAVAHPYVNESS